MGGKGVEEEQVRAERSDIAFKVGSRFQRLKREEAPSDRKVGEEGDQCNKEMSFFLSRDRARLLDSNSNS